MSEVDAVGVVPGGSGTPPGPPALSTTPDGVVGLARTRMRDYCPDVPELRRLLERVMGSTRGSQIRLAQLVGCRRAAVRNWEQNRSRPAPMFRARLVELERRLLNKEFSTAELLRPARLIDAPADDTSIARRNEEPVQQAQPMPLFATEAALRIEGAFARLKFVVQLPGEEEKRVVADVVVPKTVIATLTPAVLGRPAV